MYSECCLPELVQVLDTLVADSKFKDSAIKKKQHNTTFSAVILYYLCQCWIRTDSTSSQFSVQDLSHQHC